MMTDIPTGTAHRPGASILVVSRRPDLVAGLRRALPEVAQHRIATDTSPSFSAMNGRASALIARHDVVIFDTVPGDRAEIDALTDLLKGRPGETQFLALADEGLSIAEARKLRDAGVGEVLPNTISGADLNRAVEALLRSRSSGADGGRGGKVIAVAQARGGIGSTTVAVNLARKLVGRPRLFRKTQSCKVALVDLDLQFGNAGAFLDLEDRGDLFELIRSGHAPSAADLLAMMQRHESGLSVLCAPQAMVPLNAISPETVGVMLDTLRGHFDYVVVDLPRALVDWVAPVLTRAACLALVTDTSVPSIRQAKRLIDFLHEDNAGLKVNIIVNRESRPLMKPAQIREAESVLGVPFGCWLPDQPRAARKAADVGKPLVDLYPGSRLARAFGKLAARTTNAQTIATVKSS